MLRKYIRHLVALVSLLVILSPRELTSADVKLKIKYIEKYYSYPECSIPIHDYICKWDRSDDSEEINWLLRQRYGNNCHPIEVQRCWLEEHENDKKITFSESNYIKFLSNGNDKSINAEIAYLIGSFPYLDDSFYDLVFKIDRSKYFSYYESLLYTPEDEVDTYNKSQLVKIFAGSHPKEISEFIIYWNRNNPRSYPGEKLGGFDGILDCLHCKIDNAECSKIIVNDALSAGSLDDYNKCILNLDAIDNATKIESLRSAINLQASPIDVKDFKALILLDELKGIDPRMRAIICEEVQNDELKVLDGSDGMSIKKIIKDSGCPRKE